MRLVGCIGIALLLGACVDELSEEERPCPCAAGWYCDKSAGEPGVCRQGTAPDAGQPDAGPPDSAPPDSFVPDTGPDAARPTFCAAPVTSFIDRFDDARIDDWKVFQGKVELSGERLLALRTVADNRGLVVRRILPGAGAFSVELEVELYSSQSFAEISLTAAGSSDGYTVVLSNTAEGGMLTGLFLVPEPTQHSVDASTKTLVSKSFTPAVGKTYTLRLEWLPGGYLELFLDGVSVGRAVDVSLLTFDQLYLGGGQFTDADHGAYFDNLVVRSCGLDVPTLTPDPQNPIWQGGTKPSCIFKDGSEYRLYHAGNDNIHLATSPNGTSWTETPDVITSTETGQLYNRFIWVRKEAGGYTAWLSATSGECVEYTQVYRATSADGKSWTVQGVVLPHGAPSEYDSRNVDLASVAFDGTTYHMYYNTLATSGGDQCDGTTNPKWHLGIGYATSTDGKTWTKRGLAISRGLTGDPDEKNARSALVVHGGTGFEMFYVAQDGASNLSTVYATSPDGASWTKHGTLGIDGQSAGIVDGKLYYMCGKGMCRADVTP